VALDITPSYADMHGAMYKYSGGDRCNLLMARVQLLAEHYGCPTGVHGGKTDSCFYNEQTGAEKISTIPIEIPANASGQVSIMVTDGKQLNLLEQRELHRAVQPQTVSQMIRILNDTRRNNRIYVRLLTGTPGAVVNGEALTSLPPSVLSVLEGDRSSGDFTPIRSATLGEWDLPMDSAVTGTRVLTIDLDAHAGR